MRQNQILDIFGIITSSQDRVLRDDAEILEVIKNAYQLAKKFDEIYQEDEDYEDDI